MLDFRENNSNKNVFNHRRRNKINLRKHEKTTWKRGLKYKAFVWLWSTKESEGKKCEKCPHCGPFDKNHLEVKSGVIGIAERRALNFLCGWVGVNISPFVTRRAPSYTKDTLIYGRRFRVGPGSTSPCNMSCVAVVYSSVIFLSVCGEQSIVLTTTCVVWEFQ